MKLKNKIALITGAASDIGRASAVLSASEGAAMTIVTDIDEKGGSETKHIIRKDSGEAEYYPMDITKEDEVEEVIAEIVG